MPVAYLVEKPAAVAYCQWTGDNLDELTNFLGSVYTVQAMDNGNLRLTAAQNPSMYREFVQGTWVAGMNTYLTDQQKTGTKQEVPGPNVKYLTEEVA